MSSEIPSGPVSIKTISDLDKNQAEVEKALDVVRSLSTKYNKYLTEKEDSNHRAPGIHASEVSGCARRLAYAILGTHRTTNVRPQSQLIFDVGKQLHLMLQEDFKKFCKTPLKHYERPMTITFEEEVRISPDRQPLAAEWNIQSSCDGVFTIETEEVSTRLVLEIKTSRSTKYEKLRAPQPEHIEQAHVYMAALDIPFAWFLYMNKDTQNYTGTDAQRFVIPFDAVIWSRLERRFASVTEAAHSGVLPPKEISLDCNDCPYFFTCNPLNVPRSPYR